MASPWRVLMEENTEQGADLGAQEGSLEEVWLRPVGLAAQTQ